MFREELIKAADTFDIALDVHQIDQLEIYYRRVIEWNDKVNLTAITDPHDFAIKHVIDSLSVSRAVEIGDEISLIDVGTGAGFPGLPLKIFRPTIRLTLLDSLGKRVNFLRTIVSDLKLDNVDCIQARAEDAAQSDLRESFDLVTARAVAKLNVLAEYCLPFAKIGGKFIALKSVNVDSEIDDAKAALKILGGGSINQHAITLPNGDSRLIISIDKIKSTPKHFPRRAGIPDKKPLNNSLLTGDRDALKHLNRPKSKRKMRSMIADKINDMIDSIGMNEDDANNNFNSDIDGD